MAGRGRGRKWEADADLLAELRYGPGHRKRGIPLDRDPRPIMDPLMVAGADVDAVRRGGGLRAGMRPVDEMMPSGRRPITGGEAAGFAVPPIDFGGTRLEGQGGAALQPPREPLRPF